MKKKLNIFFLIIIFILFIFIAYIKFGYGESMEVLKENEYLIYQTGIIRIHNFKLGISGINVEFPFSTTCLLYPNMYTEDGKLMDRFQTEKVKKGELVNFDNFQVEVVKINIFRNYVIVKIIEN